MILEEVFQKITEICRRNGASRVILFGSRAKGTARDRSDIDIAVYGCKNFLELEYELNEELWSLLPLDIINMDEDNISEELLKEIERDGVNLYVKI